MSTVPAEIAGIGSTQQKLRVSPGFDPLKAAVGPEEYFVLSRIDGSQTLRDVLLATGLSVERGIAIVQRLRSIGALLLPGETSAPGPTSMPTGDRPRIASSQPRSNAEPRTNVAEPRSSLVEPRTSLVEPRTSLVEPRTNVDPRTAPSGPVKAPITATRPDPRAPTPIRSQGTAPNAKPGFLGHDVSLPRASADELKALGELNDLDDSERRLILAIGRLVDGRDPHALLGVTHNADARELKRAYFQLSKEIHPDRYYGQKLGSFAPRLASAFEAVSRAYARLTGGDKNSKTSGGHAAVAANDEPQTPTSYAAELFDRACQLEVQGDAMGAMKLFTAAVRVDGQLRYLRRAASCALAAGQPRSAVEYAKKAQLQAPNDPSSARLLAAAFRAAGKLADAEEVLVMAMALKSENDTLTAELRHDLAEVRRLLSQ